MSSLIFGVIFARRSANSISSFETVVSSKNKTRLMSSFIPWVRALWSIPLSVSDKNTSDCLRSSHGLQNYISVRLDEVLLCLPETLLASWGQLVIFRLVLFCGFDQAS